MSLPHLPRTPSFRLDGRRALVTGAGRGIGLAAAAALAEAGAHVTLAARTDAQISAGAAALEAAGGQARARPLDVTDTEAVADLVDRDGPFDILVNNAGANRAQPATEVDRETYDRITDLNVRAAFFVVQAVAKALIAAGRPGSIINVSSQMGHVGGPRRSVYCATKHAVEGMTKAMAWEFGPHNIRINTICPTFIETDLTRAYLADEAFMNLVLSNIALGRIGVVEDIMGAILFLASDASALVTGSALMVDSGWTAA